MSSYRPSKHERVRIVDFAVYFPTKESAEYVAEIVRTRRRNPYPSARIVSDKHGWAIELDPCGDLMDVWGQSANAAFARAFDRAMSS